MRITKTISKISMILALVFTAHAHADDSAKECLDPKDMKFILDLYQFEDHDDSGNMTRQYGPDDNCEQGAFRKTADAILFMRDLPAYKNTPKQFSTLVSEQGPTQFLKKRLRKVVFETTTSDTCSDGTTGAYAPKDTPGIINICGQTAQAKISPLVLSQLLLHEVRHHDGLYHVHCDDGPMAMLEYACDNSYQEQGAYGIGSGYLLYIYKGTANEALKATTRSKVIYELTSNFNKAPLAITKGALMHRTDNAVSFYDGNETMLAEFTDDVSAIAIDRGVPFIFFKNGELTKYAYKRKWNYQEGYYYNQYQKLSKDEINNLLDITLDGNYCFLLSQKMKCAIKNELVDYHFSQFSPVRFYDKLDYVNNWLGFVNEDGRAFRFPDDTALSDVSENDLLRAGRPKQLNTSFVKLSSGVTIAVSPDGSLVQSKDGTTWTAVKGFKEYKYKKIIPFYWSQKLEDL